MNSVAIYPDASWQGSILFNSPDPVLDESVGAHAFVLGSAKIDPIITPVNPNAELISLSPLNPVPDPLFTPDVLNDLTAQGFDFSAFFRRVDRFTDSGTFYPDLTRQRIGCAGCFRAPKRPVGPGPCTVFFSIQHPNTSSEDR